MIEKALEITNFDNLPRLLIFVRKPGNHDTAPVEQGGTRARGLPTKKRQKNHKVHVHSPRPC